MFGIIYLIQLMFPLQITYLFKRRKTVALSAADCSVRAVLVVRRTILQLIQWRSWLSASADSDSADMFESLAQAPEIPRLVCEYTVDRQDG